MFSEERGTGSIQIEGTPGLVVRVVGGGMYNRVYNFVRGDIITGA